MKNLIPIYTTAISILILSSCAVPKKKTEVQKEEIKHVDVYYEPGRFGGWPANHGIWIWDNEILAGFRISYYKENKRKGHDRDRDKPSQNVLIRIMECIQTIFYTSNNFELWVYLTSSIQSN